MSYVGHRGATLPHHPAQYVSTCCQGGAERGERFICWGQWESLPRPDPKESLSTIWMVGYQTSQKEIWDLYHEVYLLRSSPSLPPCRPQLREEAIQDILSSLMSQLQRLGCHLAERRSIWCSCHHLPAIQPIRRSVLVSWEERPTWQGPSGGQGSPQVGFGGHPLTRAGHWEVEPESRECPMPTCMQS